MTVDTETLKSTIVRLAGSDLGDDVAEARAAVEQLLRALTHGQVRSAQKVDGDWKIGHHHSSVRPADKKAEAASDKVTSVAA